MKPEDYTPYLSDLSATPIVKPPTVDSIRFLVATSNSVGDHIYGARHRKELLMVVSDWLQAGAYILRILEPKQGTDLYFDSMYEFMKYYNTLKD